MASLTGAVTVPGLGGTPSTPWYAVPPEEGTFPRPDDGQFSRPSLMGTMQRVYGDFTKAAVDFAEITASDTASLSATEGPLDYQEITTYDTASLSVSEVLSRLNFLGVTEAFGLTVSEAVSLIQNGVANKPVSDTASLSLTESVAISVNVDVTDTADLTLSGESVTAATVRELLAVTDGASLSIDEEVSLGIFAGSVGQSVSDLANLVMTDTAVVSIFDPTLGLVTSIKFSVRQPSIQITKVPNR